jgi:glycosyltransferase involved in cell wall biosynthesis
MTSIVYYVDGRMPTLKANGYQSVQMCQSFINSNVKILLIYQNRIALPVGNLFGDLKSHFSLDNHIATKKIPCIDVISYYERLPKFIRNNFLSASAAFLTSILSLYFLYKTLKKINFNYLYVRSNLSLIGMGIFFPKKILANIVFEVHDVNQSVIGKFLFLYSLKKVHSIITVTEHLKIELIKESIPSKQILTSPDAVDLKRFKDNLTIKEARESLGISHKGEIVGFIGRFNTNGNEKGIPEILKASKLVLVEYPDLKFYFVGGSINSLHSYESLMDELGIKASSYIFLGNQHVSLVPVYMWACNILLMPHPWSNFYAYNVSPLKLFEYMASNRPIIASELPSICEILEHNKNALLIKPGDWEQLAESIKLLLKDKKLADKVANQSLRDIKNFTWDKRAAAILNFLERTPK